MESRLLKQINDLLIERARIFMTIEAHLGDNPDKNNNIYYPGSARIWRKGETGPRIFNKIELDKSLEIKQIPVISAGQYREYNLFLSLEGDAPDISRIETDWSENDWIYLSLAGIVEDEKIVSELDKKLTDKYSKTVRKFEINRGEDKVQLVFPMINR